MNKPNIISKSRALPLRSKSKFNRCILPAMLSLLILPSLHAGSATWNFDPPGSSWGSPLNWTPETVPNTLSDTATFGVSNRTAISTAPFLLGGFVFDPGASAFTINYPQNFLLQPGMIGEGVTNNSGVLQSFSVPRSQEPRDINEDNNKLSFINSATAGTLTQWTIRGSSTGEFRPAEIFFTDTASAGSSILIVNPGGSDIGGDDGDGYGGILDFRASSTAGNSTINVTGGAAGADFGSAPQLYFTDNATAANATITLTSGTIKSGHGGILNFFGSSSAGSATITAEGGAVIGARTGEVGFEDSSTADNATLIANGGVSGANGGVIGFAEEATGGTARVILSGNGTLVIGATSGIAIGSLEGDGLISLGAETLTVGGNDLSTAFSGVIQDSGLGGALVKTGAGTLTLSGANTYTGGTTVIDGILAVNSQTGSGTGEGSVTVQSGLLAGNGTIAGATTIGIGNGTGAALAPAGGSRTPSTLTIQSSILLQDDAIYFYIFRARNQSALSDVVVANGVTISGNARFHIRARIQGALAQGLTLTVLSNTAATPIAGTFRNLPDGAIVTINGNNFQASYSGGDGNDLTLTVVP